MAAVFTVEDGTGITDANAFATVAYVDQYNSDSEASTDWFASTTPDKQKFIRLATRDLVSHFAGLWRSTKLTSTQGLPWPRTAFTDPDGYATDNYPDAVQAACAQVAIRRSAGLKLVADRTRDSMVDNYSYSDPAGKTESWASDGGIGLEKDEVAMPIVNKLLHGLIHSGPMISRG